MRLRGWWLVVGALVLTACGGDSRWVAADGTKVPDGRVVNGAAPFSMAVNESCDGSRPQVLEIAWPAGTIARIRSDPSVVRQYQSPSSNAVGPSLLGDPATNTQPPSDAVFTGYRQGRRQLWAAPSDNETYVYIKDGNTFERWARTAALFACI